MKIMRALRFVLRDLPRMIIGFLILIAIGVNFANIIGRYVFSKPLAWTEEVLVATLLWGVCLGASAVTYESRHLDMNLFTGGLPVAVRSALELAKNLTMAAVCIFTAIQAWKIVVLMHRNAQVTTTAGIPVDGIYLAFFVGFSLMAASAIAGPLDRDRQSRKHEEATASYDVEA